MSAGGKIPVGFVLTGGKAGVSTSGNTVVSTRPLLLLAEMLVLPTRRKADFFTG